MADFKGAIGYILENEGGYTNDPSDSGGETYMGVSRKNFPDLQLWKMLEEYKPLAHGEIVEDAAIASFVNTFYYNQFWKNIHGDGIDSQAIATYLFDWYVNAGGNAIKNVQRILGVDDDGVFGNGTLNALNAAGAILGKIHAKRIDYYNAIGLKQPKFLKGWLNRANGLYDILKDIE